MPAVSESTLSTWTGAPSDSEDERHDSARRAIAAAIDASSAFEDATLNVYAKGSYPNHTNVVRDSDVDVAVEMTSVTYFGFEHGPIGRSMEDFGFNRYTGGYDSDRLKDDVESALVARFGRGAVTRGNYALHVRESSTRLAADVVPCYRKRLYYTAGVTRGRHHPSVASILRADRGRDARLHHRSARSRPRHLVEPAGRVRA
jgi:tRNA nucleotidyltransferase (CCA-adding enzyme)